MHLDMLKKKLKNQKYLTKLLLLIKSIHFKEEGKLKDGAKHQGMKIDLMAIVFHALILVIRPWNVDPMEEEVLEALMTKLGVGHVIILVILLPTCYHIYSSRATIFYFSDTVHFSAKSLTYEMLR